MREPNPRVLDAVAAYLYAEAQSFLPHDNRIPWGSAKPFVITTYLKRARALLQAVRDAVEKEGL